MKILQRAEDNHHDGFAGGLIFGWNALALMLKAQGFYEEGCQNELAGAPWPLTIISTIWRLAR